MTYVLIFGVIAIWALIIQKVINASVDEDMPVNTATIQLKNTPAIKWYMLNEEEDSLDFKSDLNDPFSETRSKASLDESNTISEIKSFVPQAIPMQVIWPNITYEGFATKTLKKEIKSMAILQINQQPYTLAVGEEAVGVKLIKNWGDSIQVNFKNQSKKIYLQTK